MLGRLICKLPRWLGGGHRRGRRVTTELAGLTMLQCPRCKKLWARKAKPATVS